MVIALLTVSCGGKDEPVNLRKSVYKFEVSTTENSMYYQENLLLQIYDDNASSVTLNGAPDFEVVPERATPISKMFRSTKKAQRLSVLETSQPIAELSLFISYLFDDDIATEGDFSFICTVKVYKDNKLFDTYNYTFNKTSIEPAVLNYLNNESWKN